MKPTAPITPRLYENSSALLLRVYKRVRSLKNADSPSSHYAASIKHKAAMKPKLRLVK